MPPTDDALLRAERQRLAAAFDPVLDEPVPGHLRALLAPAPAPVLDLAAARARRRSLPTWAAWGGMAATLVLGTLLGTRLAPPATPSAAGLGDLVATGDVAQALEQRLAGDTPGAVAVQLSFKDRGGRYCRSFTTPAWPGWPASPPTEDGHCSRWPRCLSQPARTVTCARPPRPCQRRCSRPSMRRPPATR